MPAIVFARVLAPDGEWHALMEREDDQFPTFVTAASLRRALSGFTVDQVIREDLTSTDIYMTSMHRPRRCPLLRSTTTMSMTSLIDRLTARTMRNHAPPQTNIILILLSFHLGVSRLSDWMFAYQLVGTREPRRANCSICLQHGIRTGFRWTLPCGHAFHEHCVVEWFRHNPTCPICRA